MTAVLRLVPGPVAVDWSRWLGAYAARTQEDYRRDFEQWTAFLAGGRLLATPGDMNAWIAQLRQAGMADATVARKVASVASWYRWARDEGMTEADPIPRRRPKVRDDGVELGLDRAQTRAVITEARRYSPRAYALTCLLLFCGLRVSEAVGGDLDDITEEQGHRVVRVRGKGGKVRTVPVPAPAWAPVGEYVGGRVSGPVFVTASGRRWDRRSAHRVVRRIGELAGVPLHPHLLRHTAATLALDSGAAVDRVQQWLGHASLDTTMRYVRARRRLDTSPGYDVARWLMEDDPAEDLAEIHNLSP